MYKNLRNSSTYKVNIVRKLFLDEGSLRDGHLRKIKEGIFIQQAKTKSKIINDDDGLVLSNQWKPIIPVLEEKTLEKLGENKFPVVTFNHYNLRSNARPRPSVNYR